MKSALDAMPLFLLDDLLSNLWSWSFIFKLVIDFVLCRCYSLKPYMLFFWSGANLL